MKPISIIKTLFASSILLLLAGCPEAGDGGRSGGYDIKPAPKTFNILMHSSCCFDGTNPIAADSNEYHAFFEEPVVQKITVDETTDLTNLNNYHMLYITQPEIDALNASTMDKIRDWTAAGGILLLYVENDGPSVYGAYLGKGYQFEGIADIDGNNFTLSDPGHRLFNHPNTLRKVDMDGWGSTSHGAIGSPGAAYTCILNDDDGVNQVPAMCTTPFGFGAMIITGVDVDCDCHDDHLTGGTNSGSEMWENYAMLLYRK